MLANHVTREIQILLIEDDDIDAMAFRRHLAKASFDVKIHHAIDGGSALKLLRGDGTDEAIDLPHMIVLDLNMPRMSGLEFLQELRADERLRRIIVFVFTTSDAPNDRLPCFDYNVAGYLLKSRAGHRFENLISLLDSYVEVAEFPPAECDGASAN